MDNLKRNLGSPTMLVWPWWKAEEAGRGKHTDSTKTSPRNVPVLPLEIVDNILRGACQWEWPLNRTERQVLAACTLVCKSWLPLARSLLYRSLIVETGHTDTPRSPGTIGPEALLQHSHLLAFTRSLSVHVMGRSTATVQVFSKDGHPEGSQDSVQIPDFLFLLAHTPRLRFLELSIHENIGPFFEPHVLGWLSSLVLPVEALNIYDVGHSNCTFFHGLMGVWPTIPALRLYTISKECPPEMPSISLRELRIPLDFLARRTKWLLPPPPPSEQSSLLFLELSEISEKLLPVLSIHGPSVSTLTLSSHPEVEFAHVFTKLEELVIGTLGSPFFRGPLPTFPRTLKHIMLRDSDLMFKNFLPAIAQVVPTLPDLRLLSIDKVITTDTHYPDLQKACETHKVEILVRSVNSPERTAHPYHVEMDRFPRQYTFSEFFESKTLTGSSTL